MLYNLIKTQSYYDFIYNYYFNFTLIKKKYKLTLYLSISELLDLKGALLNMALGPGNDTI